jgi:prepilin-type N-terminal cleavage/methylation domain-containing protein
MKISTARKNNYGFSLIELLVVIAIIGVMIFPLFITYRTSRANQALRSSTETLADNIRTAHIYARAAKDKSSWGIRKISNTEYELIAGKPDTWHSVQTFVVDKQISLTTDFVVWFDIGTGNTATPLSVTVLSQNGKSMRIDVMESGAVEVIPL